jgi:glycosyltransferase involved in cell wall biosynthesis
VRVLGVSRDRVLPLPNGVDTDLFAPRTTDRGAFWNRVLVEHPEGWLAGQAPGSARYDRAAVSRLVDGVALVYAGRFTAVKRLDLLIAAFGRARPGFVGPAGLVLVGGHPGEWEGEHPADIAARLDVPDVFLAGWQAQEQLPGFFAASDAIVLTSKHEQFGQVLIEAMACGMPAIATRSSGPAAIIENGRTGWLVDADDDDGLAATLREAVNDPRERRRRGEAARQTVRERFSWATSAALLATILDDVAGEAAIGDESGGREDHVADPVAL